MTTPEVEYYKKLLEFDFIMPNISQISTNAFEKADNDVIAEIDKLTGVNSLQYKQKKYKNNMKVSKNKKMRYNIPNGTITRHSHIGQ